MPEYRLIYVLNPAAGHGRYLKHAREAASDARADRVYLTEGVGDCTGFIADACIRDPYTHFVVYGGDGTAGEAASGILRAGAGEEARLSVIPCGSGNDFVRGIAGFPIPDGADSLPVDLISVNGRAVLNVLNFGFDCDVVVRSERMRRRRLMPNSLSYILGVAVTLGKKQTFSADMTFSGVAGGGEDISLSGEFMLCAAANCPYYGGGFKACPAASPSDGYMDVMAVRDVTRRRFVSMVGGYHDGTHVNAETLHPYPQYAEFVEYIRCRSLTVTNVKQICLDGEVIPSSGVRAEVIPRAIRYVHREK